MPTCVLTIIGNELLEGGIIDTNSAYISSRLNPLGFVIREIRTIPDETELLASVFKSLQEKYDVVISTGGLGPTFDDITPKAVALATDRDLVYNDEVYQHIVQVLSSKQVKIRETHKQQAYLPSDAILFPNTMGTAYGFCVESGSSILISLPGVPYEMHPMLEQQVIPFLKQRFTLQPIYKQVLRFIGLPESEVDDMISQIGIPESLACTINASKGEILVRLQDSDQKRLTTFEEKLKENLASFYVGNANDTLASILVSLLRKDNEMISVAESVTGGLLGHEITSIPGSSAVFKGGVTVYSNWSKIKKLTIPEELIRTYGAVSDECAVAMVRKAAQAFHTEAAISVTGIAGPSGGSEKKPVGTVYIGLQYRDRLRVKQYIFPGDRESIRMRTMKMAFFQLIQLIKETRTIQLGKNDTQM